MTSRPTASRWTRCPTTTETCTTSATTLTSGDARQPGEVCRLRSDLPCRGLRRAAPRLRQVLPRYPPGGAIHRPLGLFLGGLLDAPGMCSCRKAATARQIGPGQICAECRSAGGIRRTVGLNRLQDPVDRTRVCLSSPPTLPDLESRRQLAGAKVSGLYLDKAVETALLPCLQD